MGIKHGHLVLLDIGHHSFFAAASNNFNKLWTFWYQRLVYVNNAHLISLFKIGCLESTIDNKMMSS